MLALGAALGGVVTEAIGVDGSLALDAATYLLSAWLLAGLPALPADPTGSGDTGFVDGLRYVRRTPYVAVLVGCKAVASLGAGMLVALPLYGDGEFPSSGPFWVGFLYAMRGVGALLGSIGLRGAVGDAPDVLRRTLLPGFVFVGAGAVLGALGPTIGLVGVGFLVAAIGQSLVWVFSNTLLQLALHPGYRGRVFSLEFGIMTLSLSTVSLVAGALVDGGGWSPDGVMVASAGLVLVTGVPWALLVVGLGRRDAAAT